MANVAKIAISLDVELLRHVELLRSGTGESRSSLVSRALRALTEKEHKQKLVEEYVLAYRNHPEAARELRIAQSLARRSARFLEWEEE